ncbi:hypothetical protein FE257_002854 [Aspergillus nanangensis]|uniref:Uncharacterized protein n=1 Tax=Aspergillus nanangensis TaxID=2582783 RepID=A0AAD4CSR2_ASPNN|nr:hypothetical protein FE257_002854 [Aspergillus nanangensis]
MRLFKYLVLAVAPLALANPEPAPQSDGGLLSQLPDILDGVKELLNQETLDDLQTIVKGAAVLLGGDNPQNLAKILSSDNVNKIQGLLNNADSLLTTGFVNDTSTLITDATPLVSSVSKLLGGLLGSVTDE